MVHRRTAAASHILAGLEPVYSGGIVIARSLRSVSYTHLTLPTIYSV